MAATSTSLASRRPGPGIAAHAIVRGGFEPRRYDASFDYAKQIDPDFVILAPFSPPRPTSHAFDDVMRGDHVGAWASDRLRGSSG